ncbi:uncharacterized protein Dvir_GJ26908 [Drosophila virilis]|uniref:Uncharacterized protein n=1 Tax=Drosophila virilis TaxID=7244 RepID=A0A0Q9WFY0_DROVI|nr:uncharacterized protein LOC26531678 [Drosophila virilis]KRF79392.1 uncharacterized protein Dvir_GJ26908 [Drosophila virilis]
MRKSENYVLSIMLIAIVVWKSEAYDDDELNNQCVECDNGDCKIFYKGWMFLRDHPKDKTLVHRIPQNTDTYDPLAECVLPGFRIKGNLENFLCFSSPIMGCQPVANKTLITLNKSEKMCSVCLQFCGCNYPGRSSSIVSSQVVLLSMCFIVFLVGI